jgi:hypothetical protein
MLSELLSRLLVPQYLKPEIVEWSLENEPNEAYEYAKTILHNGIRILVSCPEFRDEDTGGYGRGAIHVEVENCSSKALALGKDGFLLVLTYGTETSGLPCKSL